MLLRLLKGLLKPEKHQLDEKTADILHAAEQLASSGDVAGALQKCQDVAKCFSEHSEVLAARAGYLAQRGSLDESEACIRQVLSIAPDHHRALFLLGSIYLARGYAVRAVPLFERVEAAGFVDEALLANHGVALRSISRITNAKSKFEAALARNPDFMPAALPYCQILIEQKLYEDALSLLDRLEIKFPVDGRLLRLKGFILYKHFYQPEKADLLLERAEKLGENEAQFWNERGECARDMGDTNRALGFFNRALTLSPDNPIYVLNKALLGLMLEQYESAWPGYEARFGGSTHPRIELPVPRWNGTFANEMHLLIVGEQGIGDEIMFASCVRNVSQKMKVTLICAEKLLDIFRASFPDITCIAHGKISADEIQACDFAIASGSLPGFLRTSKDAFPHLPYLRPPRCSQQKVADFISGLPQGIKVGISWRGGTEVSRSVLRSLPLEVMAELIRIPGIVWVNLQYGECDDELDEMRAFTGRKIYHSGEILADYADTAALVDGLDLVVSVCTAIVHLAGALGKEVWVLAPMLPEWRYGLNFQFMPWYRRVEIFRQSTLGEWKTPLASVKAKLTAMQTRPK